jgi:hypothetical protein
MPKKPTTDVYGRQPATIRFTTGLWQQIDQRIADTGSGLSRNEWLERVVEWALSQPPRTITREERL